MAWRETLYERTLKRPVDHEALDALRDEFLRRKHEIPVASELVENRHKPEMTIKTKWLSFIIHFTEETMRVDAELSLAARMLATQSNRRTAVQFIDSIVDSLDL